VLGQHGGVLAGLPEDPPRLGLALGDPGRSPVEDSLGVGDLVRQVVDHVVDRGQHVAAVDHAGSGHGHRAGVEDQLAQVRQLLLCRLPISHLHLSWSALM
jgi:hypothetical protein